MPTYTNCIGVLKKSQRKNTRLVGHTSERIWGWGVLRQERNMTF